MNGNIKIITTQLNIYLKITQFIYIFCLYIYSQQENLILILKISYKNILKRNYIININVFINKYNFVSYN